MLVGPQQNLMCAPCQPSQGMVLCATLPMVREQFRLLPDSC